MIACLAPIYGRASYVETDRGFESPCWVWLGARNSKGYAVRGTQHERYLVHRRAFEEAGGTIGTGEEAHHRCEQRDCVNPAHIVAITPLRHRRVHNAPIVLAFLAALKEEGPLPVRELKMIAVDAGAVRTSTSGVLSRMLLRGEVVRLRRGVYALPEAA